MSSASDEIFNKIIDLYNSKLNSCEIIGFKYSGFYMRRVGCTHASPRGKPTNFFNNPNLPTYYPGINGRVWFKIWLKEPDYDFTIHIGHITMLHTANGGSGSYNGPWAIGDLSSEEHISSYTAKVFLDDFPEMQPLEDEWVRSLDILKKNTIRDSLAGKPSVLAKDSYYESNHTVPVEFFWEK